MSDLSIGSIIEERYEIISLIGKGGMGNIYLSKDIFLNNKKMVLKIIRFKIFNEEVSEIDPIQKFKHEFDVMTRLQHPNLIKVYNFGKDRKRGMYYIAMEYLEGITLENYLKHKNFDINDSLDIMVEILRTLDFIHSKNIIYRDLKPGNIIITLENGKFKNLKLLDFGLSDIVDVEVSKNIQGTIYYMAPEIIQHAEIDYKVDIFSAGIILFELISNKAFHKERDNTSIISALSNREDFNVNINRELLTRNKKLQIIINKMTAYKKEDRFNDAIEIITAINIVFDKKYEYITKEMKLSYVKGENFIIRKPINNFLLAIITKSAKFNILLGKKGFGKTASINNFVKYCQINNISYYSSMLSKAESAILKPFSDIIYSMLFYSDKRNINKYGNILVKLLPNHPLLSSFTAIDERNGIVLKNILLKCIVDFIVSFGRAWKRKFADSLNRKIIIIFDNIDCFDELSFLTLYELVISISKKKISNIKILSTLLEEKKDVVYSNLKFNYLKINKLIQIHNIQLFGEEDVVNYINKVFGAKNINNLLKENILSLYKQVGGNPLFIVEFIAFLLEKDFIIRTDKHWEFVDNINISLIPKTIEDLVENQIAKINFSTNEKINIILLYLYSKPVSLKYFTDILLPGNGVLTISAFDKLYSIEAISIDDLGYYKIDNSMVLKTIYDKCEKDTICNVLNTMIINMIKDEEIVDFSVEKLNILDSSLILHTAFYIKKYYEILFENMIINTKNSNVFINILKVAIKKLSDIYAHNEIIQYYNVLLNIYKGELWTPLRNIEEFASYLYLKAKSLNNVGKVEAAELVIKEVIQIAEKYKLYIILFNAYYTFTSILSSRQKYGEIEGIFNKIKKMEVEKSDIYHIVYYNLISIIYSHKNDYSKSLKYIKKGLGYALKYDKEDYGNDYKNSFKIFVGFEYSHLGESKKAIEILQEVYDQAIKSNDIILLYRSSTNIGYEYSRLGEMQKVIYYHEKSLEYAKKSGIKSFIMVAMLNAGVNDKDNKSGLNFYKKALGIAKEIEDKVTTNLLYNNIASSYYHGFEKYDKAIKYWKKGYAGYKELNDYSGLSLISRNLANLYIDLGKYSIALKFIKKSMHFAEKTNDFQGIAYANYSMISFYESQKMYDNMKPYIDTMFKIGKEHNALRLMSDALYYKAVILFEEKEFAKSKQAIDESYDLIKKVDDNNLLYFEIFKVKVDYIDNPKICKEKLKLFLKTAKDKFEKADIYYEIAKCTKDKDYAKKAYEYYMKFYSKSGFVYLKKQIIEMKEIFE